MKTPNDDPVPHPERRLAVISGWLLAFGTSAIWLFLGARHSLSFLAGGVLGGLSLAWLRRGMDPVFAEDQKTSKRRILAGFLLRLLLLPLSLYVMIRFLFLSVPAAVAGFAILHFSVLLEGILEAFSTKKHARTK